MLKHVIWQYEDTRGRVGVRVDDDRIALKNMGPALPAALLLPVLDYAYTNWREEAETSHRGRENPWKVDTYQGMSGARDYRLRVLQDPDWRDAPIVASVHVSMYGKMNHGMSMWLGDLPPLLAKILEDYPPPAPEAVFLDWTYAADPERFTSAGETSGLKETLASLQAMEVMSE